MDKLRNDATHGLDSERERRDVQQQLVLHIAGQNARLHGRAQSDHFVRIEFRMRLGFEQTSRPPREPAECA